MKGNACVFAFVVVALASSGVQGQELLTTQDGVVLNGTVRLLRSDAATCNVVAENAQDQYEELKVNQDQPLHLWELEFSVYNGTGRALDHLIAHYSIESPWPPCTNWKKRYELEGEFASVPVQWVSPSGHIQQSGRATPTLAGQSHSETILLLAFHGVRPQFSDWSVNYTFIDSGSTLETGVPASRSTDANSPRRVLPRAPAIPIEVASEARCGERNTQRHNCWVDVPGHSSCYAWFPKAGEASDSFPPHTGAPFAMYAWEGQCVNGLTHGHWVLTNVHDSEVVQGSFLDGKRHGYWESRTTNEDPEFAYSNREGEFANGKLHGVVRISRLWYGDAEKIELHFVDGERVGANLRGIGE